MSKDFGPWSVEPTLDRTSTDTAKIEQLQQLLRVFVNPSLEVDGKFGDDTETAVKQLQQRFHLPENGVVDAPVWRILLADPHSQGGGMVAGRAAMEEGDRCMKSGDYAGAITAYRRALEAADEIGLSADIRGAMAGNVAVAYGRLNDANSCRQWAEHEIELAGADATRRAFMLYYYASAGKLDLYPWSSS